MLHHTYTSTHRHISPVFQIVTSDRWMTEDKAPHICFVSQSQLDVERLCIKTLTQLVLAGINYYLCAHKTHPLSLMHAHLQMQEKRKKTKKRVFRK